jgi:hypothetical protein
MPKSTSKILDRDIVLHVASTCLCLHTQRAARALARLFDTALRPYGLSNGQFLEAALPTWRATHAALDSALGGDIPARLRADLRQVPTSSADIIQKGA